MQYSVLKDRWKIVFDEPGRTSLFAMPADIAEKEDLSQQYPEIAERYHRLLADQVVKSLELQSRLQPPENHVFEMQIDPEKLMMIESLGYLGDIR